MATEGQLNCAQHTLPLTAWVEEVIENQLWEKSVDLHIDMLDAQFKRPGRWVAVSLLLLSCLQDIVDRNRYEILLSIPLELSESPTDIRILHPDLLEEIVDTTPPSFYLFPVYFPALVQTIDSSLHLSSLSSIMDREVYFKEWEDADGYNRTLFVK
ncbi:hypothetical protein GCM10027422_32950 [Hymenobacter arcticus]